MLGFMLGFGVPVGPTLRKLLLWLRRQVCKKNFKYNVINAMRGASIECCEILAMAL